MPKRMLEAFPVDILVSIDKAKRYSEGHDTVKSLLVDEKSFSATIRELEIIGEAMKYILNHQPYNHLI